MGDEEAASHQPTSWIPVFLFNSSTTSSTMVGKRKSFNVKIVYFLYRKIRQWLKSYLVRDDSAMFRASEHQSCDITPKTHSQLSRSSETPQVLIESERRNVHLNPWSLNSKSCACTDTSSLMQTQAEKSTK